MKFEMESFNFYKYEAETAHSLFIVQHSETGKRVLLCLELTLFYQLCIIYLELL